MTTTQLPEAAALLNPAFGAYILSHSAAAYAAAATEPQAHLPWPSAFLVLPLVLPPTPGAPCRETPAPSSPDGWQTTP